MFYLRDTRTGRLEPVAPAGHNQLRVSICSHAARPHLGDLRSHVLCDLIRRAAELGGLHVNVWQDVTRAGHLTDGPDLAALNVQPAAHPSSESQPASIDVHVDGPGQCVRHHHDERAPSHPAVGPDVVTSWVSSGQVLFEGEDPSASNAPSLSDLALRGLDSLALRLAFLEEHYRQQIELRWSDIETADKDLRRWREQVARWANEPSAPMSRRHVRSVLSAFADDLATPTAVRELRDMEMDTSVAPGAKFETFAYLDRLLGLDLVRDVGKPGGPEAPRQSDELLSHDQGGTP